MVKPAGAAKRGANPRRQAEGGDAGFWNRPALMNLVADVVYLGAGLVLVLAGAAALQRLPVLPLRTLVVTTPLEHVTRAQIEQAASTALTGNFLTIDLAAAQEGFSQLPWVRRAAVRRHWPDVIELTIEEHDPVAIWPAADGESRLVNRQGEIFAGVLERSLPRLSAADDAAKAVLIRYGELAPIVGEAGRHLVDLELSNRGAWRARLDDGQELALGRDRQGDLVTARVKRYVALISSLREQLATLPRSVDLRYPNGFAVRPVVQTAANGKVS